VKKKKKTRVVGPKVLLGFSSSVAFWAELGPSSPPSFSFSSLPAAADNSGPLVGDSWIPCGLLSI